ncbi:cytochrome c [Scleromatobacter humisilvae]|uniref:Cytochrome c n=1 Tax=Scleromatobacter humisilvae TaxID=2897159 RepID=A0A9X1YJB5_9BURK|nr:cytochrome c [Scleromatobacter humisilvae]MCK9685828.1 cytochrome c [Scleromatobacter humisilvae]
MRLTWSRVGILMAVLLLVAAGVVAWLNVAGEDPLTGDANSFVATPEQVARGAYLARAGNCAACHTDRGGAAFAGGKGIATPFGTVFASNLTPDAKTGIGTWSAAQFWRAMHNGRSADGRLLYPAFPYPNFTEITRADSDALLAFLRSQVPVAQVNRPHALRFPYGLQPSLAVWRALFFSPGVYEPVVERLVQWNRGAYLVRSLGHCAACHSPRNAFGATRDSLELSGGLIPLQNWYAPSLASSAEAGVADWSTAEVSALLKTGLTPRGAALGPMAEVVFRSTQYLNDADIAAMAEFLKSLPQTPPHARAAVELGKDVRTHGEALYKDHCAACHGANGEGGSGPGGVVYVPLAGNRKVLLDTPANLIHIVVNGGFPPTTAGDPRPYGMPPFGPALKDEEIAVLASYVRSAWGNAAPPVSALDVLNAR